MAHGKSRQRISLYERAGHPGEPSFRALRYLSLCLLLLAPGASAQQAELETSSEEATSGYYVLSWQAAETSEDTAPRFLLEEAESPDFSDSQILYRGSDQSRFVSGKPDGRYYYRVKPLEPQSTDWSDSVEVEVDHHSLGRALTFFTIGLVVFGSTLALILLGGKRHRKERL